MKLTEEQTQTLKKWLSEGEKLSTVQTMLSEKFGINLTYMELRFLIDDIGAEIVEKPEHKAEVKEEKKAEPTPPANNDTQNPASEAENPDENEASPDETVGGNVQVSMSPIQRPGAVASGDVVFSDGTKAEWILDQTGRLGLNGAPEGYRPPDADIPDFQRKLQTLIMGSGNAM